MIHPFLSPVIALFLSCLYPSIAEHENALQAAKNACAQKAGCTVQDIDKVVWIESRHKPSAISPSGKYIGLFQMNRSWFLKQGGDLDSLLTDPIYNYRFWCEKYLCNEVSGKLTDWRKVREYQKAPEKVKRKLKSSL